MAHTGGTGKELRQRPRETHSLAKVCVLTLSGTQISATQLTPEEPLKDICIYTIVLPSTHEPLL